MFLLLRTVLGIPVRRSSCNGLLAHAATVVLLLAVGRAASGQGTQADYQRAATLRHKIGLLPRLRAIALVPAYHRG